MAAAFVCNTLNLPTEFTNHAAYVSGWLRKLREDKRELLHCAADAQSISDYVLDYHPDFRAKVGTDKNGEHQQPDGSGGFQTSPSPLIN